MIITVAGDHRLRHAPERATVHLRLKFEAKAPEKAMASLQAAVAQLSAEFESLRIRDPFPITASSIQAPGTRSWQPRDGEGRDLPLRHAATVRASVQFCDFAELAAWARAWGQRPGWSIESVSWDLTDATREALHDQAVSMALGHARHRAEVMATAAATDGVPAGDGATIRLLEVADAGLLDGVAAEQAFTGGALYARSMSGSDELVIDPEDVEVQASVHARFEA